MFNKNILFFRILLLVFLVSLVVQCEKDKIDYTWINQWYQQKKIGDIVKKISLENAMEIEDLPTRLTVAKSYYYHLPAVENDLEAKQPADLDKMELLLQSIVKANPLYTEPYLYLARLNYYHKKNIEETLYYIKSGLEIESDHIKFLSFLLQIYGNSNPALASKTAQFILLYENDILRARKIINRSRK